MKQAIALAREQGAKSWEPAGIDEFVPGYSRLRAGWSSLKRPAVNWLIATFGSAKAWTRRSYNQQRHWWQSSHSPSMALASSIMV